MKGKIKWFNKRKGYGFIIAPEQKKDIFFLPDDCLDDPSVLCPGDEVHFIITEDKRGRSKATDVLKTDFEIGNFLNKE